MRNLGTRKRTIYVFNKADLLPDPQAFLAQARERYPHSILAFVNSAFPIPDSAFEGVEALRDALRTSAQALRPIARIRVPLADGKLLAALHRDSVVMGESQADGVVGGYGAGGGLAAGKVAARRHHRGDRLPAVTTDDIRIAACREEDVPALMRFIDAHWQAGHILSRDEVLLRWQFDPGLIPGRFPEGPAVMLAWHDRGPGGDAGAHGLRPQCRGSSGPCRVDVALARGPGVIGTSTSPCDCCWPAKVGLGALGAVGANDLSTKALLTLGYQLISDLPRPSRRV